MSRIVTLYSYRGGTGKSTSAVNLACLLAGGGERVAVVDTDLQSPTVHTLLDITGVPEWISFTDYLIGRCTLKEAVREIDPTVWSPDPGNADGHLFAVPACNRSYKVAEIMDRGYDIGLLHEAFDDLIEEFELDTLVLDTHAGSTNETAVAVARSDTLVIIARNDRVDLVNAPKAVQQIGELTGARRLLAVGMVPTGGLTSAAVEELEAAYRAPAVALLPVVPALVEGAVSGVFVRDLPGHRLSEQYRQLADRVLLEAAR
jgi:MinD-like ATPase involved in chromosome partitioning or flagellar assembly